MGKQFIHDALPPMLTAGENLIWDETHFQVVL
jgi:hypothetical protein